MGSDEQQGIPATQSAEKRQRTITKFWIEYEGHKIELRRGTTVIGRSAACQIVLDDGLVSRRHAQIRVSDHNAVLEDFGSVNGVFVNGQRVSAQREVHDRDSIKMGKQELILRAATINLMEASMRFAETLHGNITMQRGRSLGDTAERAPSGATNVEGFAVLGNVADKVLALGRGAEAERVLSGSLQAVLHSSRSGASVDSEVADRAASYAVRLLAATNKPAWADYVFELFMNLRRPLPGDAVDQLYTVLRSVNGVDLTLLRNYVALLQALQHSFGPAERFLVQRIEGLERIVAL